MNRLAPLALAAALSLGLAACTDDTGRAQPTTPSARTTANDIGIGGPESVLSDFVESVLVRGTRLWSDSQADVATHDVEVYRGPGHCNWEQVIFLNVGWPLGQPAGDAFRDPDQTRQFVRDPGGAYTGETAGEFDPEAAMPADAVDTGYFIAGVSLWLAQSDPDAAYLTDGVTTERWPRVPSPFGCR